MAKSHAEGSQTKRCEVAKVPFLLFFLLSFFVHTSTVNLLNRDRKLFVHVLGHRFTRSYTSCLGGSGSSYESSQAWENFFTTMEFVCQKDSLSISNNPNYMRSVTTWWFILPYYISCTHNHHKEILLTLDEAVYVPLSYHNEYFSLMQLKAILQQFITQTFRMNAQHLKECLESFVATQKCIHGDIKLKFIFAFQVLW